MIKHHFDDMPPRAFLMQIADDLTRFYVFLWEKKDKLYRISMTWKDLSKYYHKNAFRTCLRKLNTEGLLSYHESNDGVSIELVSWEEVEELNDG